MNWLVTRPTADSPASRKGHHPQGTSPSRSNTLKEKLPQGAEDLGTVILVYNVKLLTKEESLSESFASI
jgi:hypothetical protein